MARARAVMWAKWRAEARKEATGEFKKLASDPLFIAGVMLYWGEGDKNPVNPVRISNTDSRLVRIFVEFLQKSCGLPKEKVKANLILYPDLNEQMSKKYWSSTTTIPEESFTKTQFIKGRHKTKRLSYGICVVSVSSRQLKEKVLTWIESFAHRL